MGTQNLIMNLAGILSFHDTILYDNPAVSFLPWLLFKIKLKFLSLRDKGLHDLAMTLQLLP